VPLTKDQYAVGEFGSDRADEPFDKTIRPRTTRRNHHDADADVSKESIEGRGELTGPISHDVPYLGKRWVHQVTEYDRELGISHWTKYYRTSVEHDDPDAPRCRTR
jgi:hypothetical protein